MVSIMVLKYQMVLNTKRWANMLTQNKHEFGLRKNYVFPMNGIHFKMNTFLNTVLHSKNTYTLNKYLVMLYYT